MRKAVGLVLLTVVVAAAFSGAKEEKPARTHWDMLRERRSIAELEDLLAERLTLLRSGELNATTFARTATRPTTRPKKTA